jgi:hypothetical protein
MLGFNLQLLFGCTLEEKSDMPFRSGNGLKFWRCALKATSMIKANQEAFILCRIFLVDEIYVRIFLNDFVKRVQILHKINVMRYMYV